MLWPLQTKDSEDKVFLDDGKNLHKPLENYYDDSADYGKCKIRRKQKKNQTFFN